MLIGCITNEDCTLIAERYAESTLAQTTVMGMGDGVGDGDGDGRRYLLYRSTSRAAKPYATDEAPAQLYPPMVIPSKPNSEAQANPDYFSQDHLHPQLYSPIANAHILPPISRMIDLSKVPFLFSSMIRGNNCSCEY